MKYRVTVYCFKKLQNYVYKYKDALFSSLSKQLRLADIFISVKFKIKPATVLCP